MTASIRRGGAVLLVAAILLALATVVEASLLDHPSAQGGAFWLFLVTFVVSAIAFLAATVLLAAAGATGRSLAGRVGLVVFGALWLVGQICYILGMYVTPNAALLTAQSIILALALLAGLLAAIEIARAGALRGLARWSLLGAVVVSAVTGALATGSTTTVTVLHLISAAGLIVVGISYTAAGPKAAIALEG